MPTRNLSRPKLHCALPYSQPFVMLFSCPTVHIPRYRGDSLQKGRNEFTLVQKTVFVTATSHHGVLIGLMQATFSTSHLIGREPVESAALLPLLEQLSRTAPSPRLSLTTQKSSVSFITRSLRSSPLHSPPSIPSSGAPQHEWH